MSSSANGYDGQRLLNLKTEGGRVNLTITGHPNLKVGASVDQVRASSDLRTLNGYRGGVQASYLFGPRVSVDARAGAWVFNTNATFEAQVAGLIARRILCYVRPGDRLARGQRYGFIRFGSRVDVYLPTNAKPRAAVGDVVRAAETILADLG